MLYSDDMFYDYWAFVPSFLAELMTVVFPSLPLSPLWQVGGHLVCRHHIPRARHWLPSVLRHIAGGALENHRPCVGVHASRSLRGRVSIVSVSGQERLRYRKRQNSGIYVVVAACVPLRDERCSRFTACVAHIHTCRR